MIACRNRGAILLAEKLLQEDYNGPRRRSDAEPEHADLHGRQGTDTRASMKHCFIKPDSATLSAAEQRRLIDVVMAFKR